MKDRSKAGVEYDFVLGGIWDSELIAVLYRTASTTEQDIEDTKEELERYGGIEHFKINEAI